MADITHEELEKTERLLSELEDTNMFRYQNAGNYMTQTCIAIHGLQREVDDFYESIDSNDYGQPDPQDVLDAILDNVDLDKYRKELRSTMPTGEAEKVIDELRNLKPDWNLISADYANEHYLYEIKEKESK